LRNPSANSSNFSLGVGMYCDYRIGPIENGDGAEPLFLVVEVEVDVALYEVRIARYVAFHDSGRQINPMIVDGQIMGGIAHGIGNALYELMGYDDTAQPLTTTLAEYLLLTSTEMPPVERLYRETPSPINPLGAKGVGKAGTIPAAAAIISAVEDALSPFSIRLSNTPVTPEMLFEAIAAARSRSPAFT
jgi:carbon-monoxide dehydrogenase large subunit